MLVDDEDDLRSMLGAALSHSGFKAHPATEAGQLGIALNARLPTVWYR